MNGPPRSYSNSNEYTSNYNNSITIPGTRFRRRSRNQSSRNSLSSIGSQNRRSIEGTIVPHMIYGWNEERGTFVNELNNNAVIPTMILNLRTPKAVTRKNSKYSTEKVHYRTRHLKKTRKRAATAKPAAKHAAKPNHSRKKKYRQKRASRNSTK